MERPGGGGSGWRALPVGPGGVPPDQVRPIGPPGSTPPLLPPAQIRAAPVDPDRAPTEPPVVLGWFGPGNSFARADPFDRAGVGPLAGDSWAGDSGAWDSGAWDLEAGDSGAGDSATGGAAAADTVRRRRAVLAVTCLGLAALAVVLAGLLSTDPGTAGTGSAADLNPGDCLASAGGTTVIALRCDDSGAEFVIAERFDRTADDGRCVATASDVVLVTRDDAVMCLNYLARVGECLYAGDTDAIGKAPCPGAGSPTRGLFRVIAVLGGTVSSRDCPAGTLHTLVHRADREVVCLGSP